MKRRANGEGNVRQRPDGRWECRVMIADGRRRSIYGETQREVLDKLRDLQRGQELGVPIPTERQSVGEHLTSWLEHMRTRVRPRTWIRYEQLARVHTGTIARVPLAKLGPQHLDRLYGERLEAGAAPMSVRHLHALLHKALDQGAKWGVVARNVADLVEPPQATREPMRTLDESEFRRFLAAVEGERFAALYVVAITSGMRLGELLGLRWQDVDLEQGSVQIQRNLQWVRGEAMYLPPKTKKSRRNVNLSATAVEALRRHRTRQLEERLAAAGGWADLDLIFPDESGRPTKGDRVRWAYWRILEGAGLPRIRLHDLRHTAATIPLGRGVHPKIVSEMLGHSTTAITMDLYSHVTPTMQREAAAVMDAVAGGRKR